MTDSDKRRHITQHSDTQHNDILHHKKLTATLSIMTLSMMAVLLCCVPYMPSVTNKPINLSIVMLSFVTLSADEHSSLLRVQSY